MRWWVITRRAAAALVAGALALAAGAGAAARLGRPHAVTSAPAPPVMLDPGHGGVDGGTSFGGLLEKEITLDVALRTAAHLRAAGVPVELTRSTDTDLGGGFSRRPGRHRRDLAERVRRTHACGAAFLVSLHVNAGARGQEGALFLYQKGNPAARALAEALQAALQPLHPRREEPIGRSNLFLLRRCAVPAVLVELGFLTHPEDRRRLADPAHRERLAAALAAGIRSYYVQRRPGGAPPH